jgi:ATP-dependent Clp protease adaptor protein ClpS
MTGDLAQVPIFADLPADAVEDVRAVKTRAAFAAKGPGKGKPGRDDDDKTGLITKTRPVTKKPSLYKVLLLNDDYTPMEFVVHVLERFFSKGREGATQIMLHVHQKGVGVCGVYTYEVAETKVTQVMDLAKEHQHPLQCRMEKE